MADTFNKQDREKKKRKKKQDKAEKKKQRKEEGKSTEEFYYLDEDGNFTTTPPDLSKKKEEVSLDDIAISTPKKEDLPEEDKIRLGVVNYYNEDKGYGFIVDKATNESYFVHIDNMIDEVYKSDKVEFEIGKGPKGPIAINVKLQK